MFSDLYGLTASKTMGFVFILLTLSFIEASMARRENKVIPALLPSPCSKDNLSSDDCDIFRALGYGGTFQLTTQVAMITF